MTTVTVTAVQCRTPDLGGTLPLIDAWLRPGTKWSLAEEYPQVFGPRSRAVHHLLVDGSVPCAHAATLDLDVMVGGEPWRTRLVGSVVVDPERRGAGYGRQLVEEVRTAFLTSRRDALVLWSDKPEFYAKSGFAPFGHEYHVTVPSTRRSPQPAIRPLCEADLPELLRLHESKQVRSLRSRTEFAELLRIPECRSFVLDGDGGLRAYAAIGKGLDFPDFVHEVGGADGDVEELVRGVAAHEGRNLGLLVPGWRRGLRECFTTYPAREQHLALGILRKEPDAAAFDGFDSI